MGRSIGILALVCLILLSGCGSGGKAVNNAPDVPTVEPTAGPSPEVVPTEVIPTATAEPTAPPVTATIEAEVSAVSLNMRTGPSMLHNILNQYAQGEVVTLIGAAPGREWVKVIADDAKSGWMNIQHLTLKGDTISLPILPISESLVIEGKVVDASGNGVPGIDIGVTRIGGATRVRVDGITDANGVFYAYAPAEYQGTWLATVVGVNCTSPIVDVNCRYAGVFTPAEGVRVSLPQDVAIEFTYK